MFVSRIVRVSLITFGLAALLVGCAGRPSLFLNSDESLRKTSAEFAADAVSRFPFPTTAPAGDLKGGVVINVGLHSLQITNLSDVDWTHVDVWLNSGYVVHVPKIEANHGTRTLNFAMFFNRTGQSFPQDWSTSPIKRVNIVMDSKVYTIDTRLGD